jgi:hypothetical protein
MLWIGLEKAQRFTTRADSRTADGLASVLERDQALLINLADSPRGEFVFLSCTRLRKTIFEANEHFGVLFSKKSPQAPSGVDIFFLND